MLVFVNVTEDPQWRGVFRWGSWEFEKKSSAESLTGKGDVTQRLNAGQIRVGRLRLALVGV